VLDEADNLFLHMVGMRWANTWQGIGIRIGKDVALSVPTIYYLFSSVKDREVEKMMEVVYDDPAHYQSLIRANRQGWFSHEQLSLALRAKRDFMREYLDKIKNSEDTLYRCAGVESEEANEKRANAYANIVFIKEALEKRRNELDVNSAEYYMAENDLKLVELTLTRWNRAQAR
jgi:hypothetical protein